MREQRRIVIVLTAISVIAGALLTGVALYTGPYIEANARAALRQAVSDVLPGVQEFKLLFDGPSFRIYEGRAGDGKPVGYALYRADSGFQDKIALIVGVSPDLQRVFSLSILEQKETPGLGAKIADEKAFLQFWRGKSLARPIAWAKPPKPADRLGPSEVNAISGATISSKAVVRMVNDALAEARRHLGGRS